MGISSAAAKNYEIKYVGQLPSWILFYYSYFSLYYAPHVQQAQLPQETSPMRYTSHSAL